MAFANTFITLDDVDISSLSAGKFLRVRPSGNIEISQFDITTDTLTDIDTTGAYTPSVGQTLVYTAAGKFRPQTLDVYSAGNGLNKSGLTLNVTAGTGGGLVANTSGVFIADVDDATNVATTHGNATTIPSITVNSKGQITGVTEVSVVSPQAESLTGDYIHSISGTSGQIVATGGTGNKANTTLNLVATGVTAGIYGNATAIPRITVDTYGRISSVDVVDVVASGGGGNGNVDLSTVTTLAYSNIHVSGHTSLGADRKDDDLTFAGGLAIDASTDASTDTISFALNPTDAAANMSISGFSDVDASGITNGQVLIWNSSTSKFEAGDQTGSGGGSNVTLTDFSVTTATPSGNGSLTYDNAGVFTFTPANVQAGGGSTQSLSWESANSNLTISSGNSVDLSALSQTLSISGNVITISGSSDTVDLTSALGDVAGNYGDSNVASYLSTNGYSNVDSDAQTLSLSANILTISGSNSTVDVGKTRFYYANQTDFPSATTYHGAIAHSHADAAMYFAHGGSWNKLANNSDLSSYQTTTAATTANTNMQAYVDALETKIIGGANVNLDSLAEVANALANSNTELSTVAFTGTFSDLQSRPSISLAGSDLTYDGTTLDLSGVGAQGPQGNAGADGVSVTSATLSSDNLILTLSNASTIDAGNVRGPVGPTGATGPQGDGNAGISSATITAGNLVLTLNDSTTVDAGNVKGDTGDTGASGVGITSTALVGGNLTLTYSNTSTQDVGNIQGPQGDAGTNGVDVSSATVNGSGNLIITLSDASTIDAGNVKGTDGAVDQTLSVSGNVITISGNNDTVDLTTMLAPYSKTDTDAQDLSLSGNVISLTGQSGNVDLTSLLGAYVNTDSQTLSVNNSSNVITISGGNTIDLSDVLANASGATSLLTLTDVGSDGTNGQVLTTDGNGSFTFTTVSGGGGAAITVQDEGGNLATSAETINFVGAGVTATGTGATKTITIPGGSGVAVVQRFKLNYDSSGGLDSTSDLTSLITSATINSDIVTVTFDSSINYPPASIMIYGYDYTNNKYLIVPMETTMSTREIAGGGSSGSPTLFGGSATVAVDLRLREAETGASRSFGTTTHAWIEFVVYD